MGNGKRLRLGGPLPLPVRLATAVGCLVGASIALLWRPEQFSGSLWLGMVGFCLFAGIGGILGRFVGGLVYRPPGDRPPGRPLN